MPLSDPADRTVAELFVYSDQGGPDAAPDVWLGDHGWLGQQTDLVAELEKQGRPAPDLFDPTKPDPLRLSLFSASLPG